MSGISCGIFIWPPIVRYLIDEYTWRGAFYITAGILAQCLILISLLRPAPKRKVHQKVKRRYQKLQKMSFFGKCEVSDKDHYSKSTSKTQCEMNQADHHESMLNSTSMTSHEDKSSSEINDNHNLAEVDIEKNIENSTSGSESNTINRCIPDKIGPSDEKPEEVMVYIDTCKSNKMKKSKFHYLIWGLYTLCYTAQCTGHILPIMYYPLKGHQDGIHSHQIPFVISVIGGMGIFMRPAAGFISDRFINRLTLATLNLVLCGILLCVSNAINTFPALLAVAVILGISQCKYSLLIITKN